MEFVKIRQYRLLHIFPLLLLCQAIPLQSAPHHEVLTIQVGENESAKYWLSLLNELKSHGVQDVFIVCADGLTGIQEAIAIAFPQAEYQRCIVHQVRNTLRYVSYKDRK